MSVWPSSAMTRRQPYDTGAETVAECKGGQHTRSDTRPASLLPALLDSGELARRLGVTERHVRRLVAERRIPFVKVGRFVRFDQAAVADWLARASVEALR
jgi:excisionase family DNA binding protein